MNFRSQCTSSRNCNLALQRWEQFHSITHYRVVWFCMERGFKQNHHRHHYDCPKHITYTRLSLYDAVLSWHKCKNSLEVCLFYKHVHTYLLTPWSRVLLEKLTGFQPVKKFPAFYGTRRFITAFTRAHHLSLSWASSIQSIPPHPLPEDPSYYPPIYAWVSQVVSFPQVSPPKPCICMFIAS